MIPVIDASALDGGSSKARRALCDAIGEACRGIGFFYVTGHGVPEALIAATYEQAARFHALPDDEKHRYHIAKSRNHRGYVPPGEEDYGDEPGQGRKESFDLAADLPADDPDFVADFDAWVEPLPPFVTAERPPRYPGFRSGEHILSEYAKGFRYLRALQRDGVIRLATPPGEASVYMREPAPA